MKSWPSSEMAFQSSGMTSKAVRKVCSESLFDHVAREPLLDRTLASYFDHACCSRLHKSGSFADPVGSSISNFCAVRLRMAVGRGLAEF